MNFKLIVTTVSLTVAGTAAAYAAYRIVKKSREEGTPVLTVIVQAYNTTVDEIRNKL
ncbi:hypothetical protein D3C80_1445740 [compost metagenome]